MPNTSYATPAYIEVVISGKKIKITDQEHIKAITDLIQVEIESSKVTANSQWITSQQTAELLGISRPTLIKLSDAGKIPFTKNGNRKVYHKPDILLYKRRREDSFKKLSELNQVEPNSKP